MGNETFSEGFDHRQKDRPPPVGTCPSLEAARDANRVWHGAVEILSNERIALQTYRLQFLCPPIARRITPGQFVMVRLPGSVDPLFGRALALYDLVRDQAGLAVGVQLVYRVVGRVTGILAQKAPGDRLEVWGPLGNGFPADPVPHLVMVAGGIGFTPFLALGQEALGRRQYGTPARSAPWAEKVSFCYGESTAAFLAPLDEFQQTGIEVHISTEDGSRGRQGLVTELIEPVVAQTGLPCRIVCCGPEPMMAATAQIARRLGLPCLVSLERPMACGLGVCFSCVVRVRDESGGWDYRRACAEGPIFDAHQIVWDTEESG
ncbi:MAG TPA: dihydroorotate dehydrogenase electron transfer subunit [Thermoguttaceae bacterium]|nr:dihydroorotate dehydrogenase electron transfer subunit [Thermoguttaceae bacterium]